MLSGSGGPGHDIRASLAAAPPVGEDLLGVDWEATPLGPPENWQRSLQTMVTALVGSRFSMWMAWGPDLTFFCNDAYRRATLGVKYPWALGRPASEVWAEIWPEIGPRIEKVLATGQATWDEALLLFLERSGYPEETYHTFSYSVLRADDGAPGGMLCVVTEDTDRVVGQRRLDMLRQLSQSTASLNSEADVLAAVGALLAGDRRSLPFTAGYLFEDGSGRAALAWTSGVPEGHPVAPDRIDVEALDSVWAVPEVVAGGTVMVDMRERFADLPSGAWQQPPTTALVVPLDAPGGGRPYGFMIAAINPFRPMDEEYRAFVNLVAGQIATALSSARAYESERRRAEQLAELDAAKTAFFTNISHELRTPLTLILGPAEDMLGDTGEPLSEPQRRRTVLVARNAQRLLSLVNSLLDFSRLQDGRAMARFQATDLAAETVRLAAMFESAMQRTGLAFHIDVARLPSPVYVDREMWSKIVLNLISNALKFTFTGGITVRLGATDGYAELEVIDTGVGIAYDQQPHLFERFHRVPGTRSRSHEGSGIGLALVGELAALHGGEVRVESAPEQGSTFSVRLPLGRDHLPSDQIVDQPDLDPAPAPDARAMLVQALHWLDDPEVVAPADTALPAGSRLLAPLVLVVDDSRDMRDYVCRLLSSQYRVQSAADGAEGLALARAMHPDLVISDVMMPNLDGFGLLAALREDPATTAIPVVFLSARAGEDGTVEGLEAGADDYLVKPFAARELLARVRANLELDRSRRTRAELERSRELLDQAQRLAQVGSWEVDLASGAVDASEQFLQLVGITGADLAEGGLREVVEAVVHPDERQYIAQVLEASRLGAESFEHEIRVVHPEAGERWVRVRGEAVAGPDGHPHKLRGFMQDITAEREAQRQIEAMTAAREAAAQEHRIADELQAALLPGVDVEPQCLEVATYYRAGMEGTLVGGDWYDVIDLGAGRTALVLGDVMGRGVRAAAVMGQLRSAIRAYARLDLGPADVLESLDGVVRDLDEDQIVTCVYVVYDSSERVITWANAGHPPPLLAETGRPPVRLTGSGSPLGTGPLSLSEHRQGLAVGAVLALYTDGLVESRERDLDSGIDRLARQLSLVGGHLAGGPQALVDALLPEGPDDDVAILLARVPDESVLYPRLSRQVLPDCETVASVRDSVALALAEWNVPADKADDAVLVVSELVTNAILYGRPPIELRLRRVFDELVLEVWDAAEASPRRLRPTIEDEHGRGLQLVAALSARWGTRAMPDGKCVWCTFSLEPQGAVTG